MSIESITREHRATVRKMIWLKILVSIGLILMGWIIPMLVDIDYIKYVGNALIFSPLILIFLGIRTLHSYNKINKSIIPKKIYSADDILRIKEQLNFEITRNESERKIALILLIMHLVLFIIAVLFGWNLVIAGSLIPIALIFAIEFCFILILIYKQNESKELIH